MSRYADTVVDQYGNPVSGVQITVLNSSNVAATLTNDAGGALGNPFATDTNGAFAFNAASGSYTLQFRLSASLSPFRTRAVVLGAEDAAAIDFLQAGTGAVTRTAQAKMRDSQSVKDFGTLGDGAPGDGARINTALAAGAGGVVVIPYTAAGYLCEQQIVVPDNTTLQFNGWGTVLKKGFNGALVSLGKRASIRGGQIDGNSGTYTGDGIVIATGDNTTTLADQGHQVVEDMLILHVAGYPVDYTTAGKGWMSEVRGCKFSDYGLDAAVKWPDEPTTGGNRKVFDCYSEKAIVNVGGCDNGIIRGNTTGGSATTNQGVVFPSGTTNRAKKIVIVGNRFAISGGTLNFRGSECQFDNNIIAGNVSFESNAANDGATASTFTASNTLTGTFTDSSGASNNITFNTPVPFTPTWAASGSAPAFGNADVRCDYTRDNGWITATYNVTLGSTSTIGTGNYTFTLPVAPYTISGSTITTDFCGPAYARTTACTVRTVLASGSKVQIYTSGGSPVGAAVPGAWTTGDQFIFTVRYRIY